jgi:hypothetical protein
MILQTPETAWIEPVFWSLYMSKYVASNYAYQSM